MPRLTKAQAYLFRGTLEEYNHCCGACASPMDLERDHIEPTSLGGSDEPENWQVLCHHCNNAKNGTGDIPKFSPKQPEWDVRQILVNRERVREFLDECRRA